MIIHKLTDVIIEADQNNSQSLELVHRFQVSNSFCYFIAIYGGEGRRRLGDWCWFNDWQVYCASLVLYHGWKSFMPCLIQHCSSKKKNHLYFLVVLASVSQTMLFFVFENNIVLSSAKQDRSCNVLFLLFLSTDTFWEGSSTPLQHMGRLEPVW